MDPEILHDVNGEAKEIAKFYQIADRANIYSTEKPFVNLKDTKATFSSNPSCRLLNPAKTSVGKISKSILDKIIPKIKKKCGLDQWRSSSETIHWFLNLDNTRSLKFLKLDIDAYYPSISISLLK